MLGFFLQKPSNSADSDIALTEPVVRRLVASLLSDARNNKSLRQIVPSALDNTAALFLRPVCIAASTLDAAELRYNQSMYTLQEVEEALDRQDWLLSDTLYKMERFAEAQGLTPLAKWCKNELEGYYSESLTTEKARQQLPYRVLPVKWLNIYDRPVILDPSATSYNSMPILNGVSEIESFVGIGMALSWPEITAAFNGELRGAKLHPDNLKAFLMRVRLQARRMLHDSSPRIPDRVLLYPSPNFGGLVQNADLAKILGRRWTEANLAFDAGAYLATIILLGSILEGVLLDKVEANPKQANQAASAPKKDAKVVPFREWMLDSLIQVAHECAWIKKDTRDFSVIVRDYRNFVHPNKEREQRVVLDTGTCRVVWEVVTAALK